MKTYRLSIIERIKDSESFAQWNLKLYILHGFLIKKYTSPLFGFGVWKRRKGRKMMKGTCLLVSFRNLYQYTKIQLLVDRLVACTPGTGNQ